MKTITVQLKAANLPITVNDSKGQQIYIEEPDGFGTKMNMKTITVELVVKDFPITINDSKGNKIYREDEDGGWKRWRYDSNGDIVYYDSYGNQTVYWNK